MIQHILLALFSLALVTLDQEDFYTVCAVTGVVYGWNHGYDEFLSPGSGMGLSCLLYLSASCFTLHIASSEGWGTSGLVWAMARDSCNRREDSFPCIPLSTHIILPVLCIISTGYFFLMIMQTLSGVINFLFY